MNGFFGRIGESLRSFMTGRYGIDEFSLVIVIVALALSLVAGFTGFGVLTVVSFACLGFVIYRCYSSDIGARTRELEWFRRVTSSPKKKIELASKKWKNRATTCYFTCKNCGTTYSVPKGKGTLRVTCPTCHEQTIHHT